jgi:prephenate dehydrogenase
MADLKGVTAAQQRELQDMLQRMAALWAELTRAAEAEDRDRVAAIQREIAECRARVETIKRSGTLGSA